jgi:hypothetical protein
MGDRCPSCDPEKSLKDRVADAFAYVSAQVASGKRHGAEMSKAEDLLAAAQFLMDAGSYEDAQRIIGEAGEVAGDTLIQYDALVSALRKSARKIKEAQDAGVDTTEAVRYLELAEDARVRTEYKLGITYAVKGAEAARNDRKKPAGTGWQSGL